MDINFVKCRAEKEKEKGKEKEGLAKLSFPAPQTLSKAKALMKNNNNHVFSVFNAFLVNSGESAQTNSNAATAIIPIAQNTVTNIWSRGSDWEMDKLTIQAFADIYGKLNIALPNMEVGDKLIAAQKMTDLMLNTFSPIGSKPEFEKFRNNYGISKMSNNEIRELTGYNGNVEDLMKNVKTELNIREKIQIDKEVLGEDPAKKAPKVENIDVLQKEKIVE